MSDASLYTTKLGAGLGLIDETRTLLEIWTPGMSAGDLRTAVLRDGTFPNMSARRLRNVVLECFAPRYLSDDARPARLLKTLLTQLSGSELRQLMFLFTCRTNPVLADFVREVYWPRYVAGAEWIRKDDTNAFVRRAVDEGRTRTRWSEIMAVRVQQYLLGACGDFGLLGRRNRTGRRILPFRIEPRVSAILAQDLHARGLGDNRLVSHEDWGLFGLDAEDVRGELRRLALTGQIIVQSAGAVTHIGWKHDTMEAFVDEVAQG